MGLRRSHSASGSAGLTIQSPADTSDRRGGGWGVGGMTVSGAGGVVQCLGNCQPHSLTGR